MKKNKISKNWINRQRKDIYVRKSKIDGFRSRAVYKLQELDEKFNIINNDISLIDLGAAPGSWSQYAAKKIKKGKILSIDLNRFDKISNIKQLVGDFTEYSQKSVIKEYFGSKVDVVLSDMAVNTTGNKDLDSIQTGELCKDAMNFSKDIISKKGFFISKIFMGGSFNEIIRLGKMIFKEVKVFKPKSSRKDSKESFIICRKIR